MQIINTKPPLQQQTSLPDRRQGKFSQRLSLSKNHEGITGFSVVDYDKNRKYRFLVATADGKVANSKARE